MGWNDFVGKAFTREEFARYVATLHWSPTVWNPARPQMPSGIVLHNTASPTLAQWAEAGPSHDARIRNLKAFYRDVQHWNGGPHLFISRDWINVFDGLLERGTHSPSFNDSCFGIEMVGDYDTEAFDSGDGAKVRDNAVFAMAVLCRTFRWKPDVIKLHKEDPRTTHVCPGKNVVKADVLARVAYEIVALENSEAPLAESTGVVATPKTLPPARFEGIVATVFGGAAEHERGAYTGTLIDDQVVGVALPARIVGNRPKVRVLHGLRSVLAEIVDVGPWNTIDPYWETGARPQAESGVDMRGRRTNRAGIDLTPACAKAINIDGLGVVDWEFEAEKPFI